MTIWGDLLLVAAALVGYAIVVHVAHLYGRNWQPPASMADSNWTMRRTVGIVAGALGVFLGAALLTRFVANTEHRMLLLAQMVLCAAAGATDIRKFQLPFPLTVLGIALAFFTAVRTNQPFYILAFGMGWAIALCFIYSLLTKRNMAYGDYIAAVWIGLAAPFNGLFAILAGDIANFIYVKANGVSGKKVAAAGAWLIAVAVVLALPPFFEWFNRPAIAMFDLDAAPVVAAPAMAVLVAKPQFGVQQNITRTKVLLRIAQGASDATAYVAFANTRAERVQRAKQAAQTVAGFKVQAAANKADPTILETLQQLTDALASYNVDAIRGASENLYVQREALAKTWSHVLAFSTPFTATTTQN